MNKNHIMYRLFNSFEQNNILYIHFKSNTNLDKSFEGKGDFDVLVDKNRISDIETLIIKCNGKRHNPVHIGSYPGVDNWLVFDDLSGKIYHLHLHYQLATGKSFVKDYVIPWNDVLFSTRVKDPNYGIYITNPNVELLLLTFRIVLKAKLFDRSKKLFGLYKLNRGMQIEWDDLSGKVSHSELLKVAEALSPGVPSSIIDIISKKELTSSDFFKLHIYIRKAMSNYRRISGLEATVRSCIYNVVVRVRKIMSVKFGRLSILRKTSLQGGLIIAFVGVDGAGKSTVSNEITKWIRLGKIECRRFYMGTGDGKTTFLNSLVKKVVRLKDKGNGKVKQGLDSPVIHSSRNKGAISLFKTPYSFLKKAVKIYQISSVQSNNKKKIIRMNRYRLNGGISVLDRWPQIEIPGQNDGPKVKMFEDRFTDKWYIKRRIEKEKSNLGIVKEIKPDLVFRLNISIDTCMNRKPEHINRKGFENKLYELNQLNFQGAKVIEVNAELPYDEELLEIKRILWNFI